MSLRRGATNVFQLSKYQNRVTRAMPANAVVTGTLKDLTSAAVTGATTIAMPFEPATDESPPGYRGYITDTVLLPDAEYDLFVTATWAGNVHPFSPERQTVV